MLSIVDPGLETPIILHFLTEIKLQTRAAGLQCSQAEEESVTRSLFGFYIFTFTKIERLTTYNEVIES